MSQPPPLPSPAQPPLIHADSARGIPWLVAAKVILFVVYFAISIIIVRWLDPESYGVFSLCRNIGEYLVVICALGLNSALSRFIPELVVHRNRAGLIRLLWKTALLQGVMVILAVVALHLATPLFDRWFKTTFGLALVLAGLVAGGQIAKDYFNDTFTALFRMRTVVILSASQALLWMGLLLAGLAWLPSPAMALLAQALSMILAAAAAAWLLLRFLRGVQWRSPPQGIGRRRTLGLSVPTMLNTSFRMLMLKYTEVFFLGTYFTPAVVGAYDLGYSLPQSVLSLVPASLQTLFTSSFAHAYARDQTCLPRLIRSVYKFLLLGIVPLAIFGCALSPRLVVLIYGEGMRAAGPIASTFSLLHILPLISLPLSMAIIVKEEVLKMFPYMVMQVLINILLDFLLIPRWGVVGAMVAVGLTFLVTIPWRLRAVRKIIGGIHFPVGFLVRVALLSALLAGILGLASPWLNLPLLIMAAGAGGLAWLGLARATRLIRADDLEDLRLFSTPAMNRALTWMANEKRPQGGCP